MKEIFRVIGPFIGFAIGAFLVVTKSVDDGVYHTEGAIVALGGLILCLACIWDIFKLIRRRRKKEPIQPPVPTRGNGT
jgi:hypothetical protein